jgi:adenine-specific DNA-methyltransferase
VWDGVLDDLETLAPYGTQKWRLRNRVLTRDALTIWPTLDDAGLGPAIFYADPPYSKEHYSRYYHVLESLERYDYPTSSGAGRYRSDRFNSSLATKSGVLEAATTLFREISDREGMLVLSYPSTGLLTGVLGINLTDLLNQYFNDVDLVISQASTHSTLGGRHGKSHHSVVEYVWTAV